MVHIDYCGTFKSYLSRLTQHRYSFHQHSGLRDLSHAPHIPNLHDTNSMKKKYEIYSTKLERSFFLCPSWGRGDFFLLLNILPKL